MSTILNSITCGEVLILAVDTDPRAGVPAPIGSISYAVDGSGAFYKFGAADTDWGLDDTSGIFQDHTTGATVTVTDGVDVLLVNPNSLLAALTITMPSVPRNGQEVTFIFGGTIASGAVVTTLTISPNTSQTVFDGGLVTTANAGNAFTYKYRTSTTTWQLVR